MNATKIIIVSHYEHIGTITDGAGLTQKIEAALKNFSSDEWRVRSAETVINADHDPDPDWQADKTYTATIILDRVTSSQ